VFGRLRRRVTLTSESAGCKGGNIGHGDERLFVRDRRTNYQAGADFERKVRDHLMHDLDACYVVRSAGSRGIVDLVAFFMGEDYTVDEATNPWSGEVKIVSPVVRLVQVKRTGKITDEDREILCSLAAETGATPWLAWPVKVGRAVHVEMEQLSDNPNAEATEIRRG
jgi:Holliday junction resolvase